jgi:hypothetical protein
MPYLTYNWPSNWPSRLATGKWQREANPLLATCCRMESTCKPGLIQVSDATRTLLADREPLVPTGGIEVKGKGTMQTHVWTPPDDFFNRPCVPPLSRHRTSIRTIPFDGLYEQLWASSLSLAMSPPSILPSPPLTPPGGSEMSYTNRRMLEAMGPTLPASSMQAPVCWPVAATASSGAFEERPPVSRYLRSGLPGGGEIQHDT